ncbi:MAG: redoxin family protein [Limisphaerales bacterium]
MSAKIILILLTAFSLMAAELKPANSLPADADAAWKEVENASKPPVPPSEWAGKAPTQEQRKEFYLSLADKSEIVADKAREFYTRFPDHAKAAEAKEREQTFRRQATQFRGSDDSPEKLSPEEEAFRQKMNDVQKRALQKRDPSKPRNGMADVIKEMEKGLRDVMQEFPERPEPWQQLLSAAEYAPAKEDQLRILGDIVKARAADEQTVERAKAAIRAVGALGHPLEMSFTASDGRKVDVQKMKGKVVLIDFWASWCGPCIASLPEVIDIHKKYHAQGFEIIGINMDKQQNLMEGVVHKFKMPWPQYFDGKGWGTKFALEYNVTSIPSVWLVDKKGILRTMNAREDMEKQIADLLAEKI